MDRGVVGMETLQPPKERRVVIRGRYSLARDPSEEIPIRDFDEPLEFRQFVVREDPNLRICETTHDEIHFAHATMPSPEEGAATAGIEVGARACRPAHGRLHWCNDASRSDDQAAI
jgi:hypothetical protein